MSLEVRLTECSWFWCSFLAVLAASLDLAVLAHLVRGRLALFAMALPHVMLADPTSFTLSAVVLLAVVLTNPAPLALSAEIPAA